MTIMTIIIIIFTIIITNGANLWEIPQYFRHLVSALAAADIDDDVAVGEFWQRLRDDCFTTAERTGYCTRTTLYTPATHTRLTTTLQVYVYLD